jgi:hypothetical protein
MSRRPFLSLSFVIGCSLCGISAGQTGPPLSAAYRATAAEVQRQLHSSDPADVAWGAFNSAEFLVREAIPDLEALLKSPVVAQPAERGAMIAALLDAGVQLRADFPSSVLRNYYAGWPIQTLILLGLSRDSGPVLVDLLKDASGYSWYAIANDLLERKQAGFAAEVLTKLRFQLSVTASDTGGAGLVGGGGYGSVADGIGQNPEGFPPHAFYSFESLPRAGVVVLSNGPHPIYYSRIVYNQWQYPSWFYGMGGPTNLDRIEYVTRLVDAFAERTRLLQPEQSLSIQWTTPADFVREVIQFRRVVILRYRGLISSLRAKELLTDSEAAALNTPQLDLQVIDSRTDQSTPLPTIPAASP